MEDEEGPCKDWWSMNCCWVGKWSIKIVVVELFFRNLLTSSQWGHYLVKWSTTHISKGSLSFLFDLDSTSIVCDLIYFCWFIGFLDFFPFFPFFPKIRGLECIHFDGNTRNRSSIWIGSSLNGWSSSLFFFKCI